MSKNKLVATSLEDVGAFNKPRTLLSKGTNFAIFVGLALNAITRIEIQGAEKLHKMVSAKVEWK